MRYGRTPQEGEATVGTAYWLRHCHGFSVDTPRRRLGIVEDVLYGAEHDRPSALAVRGGLLGRRLELVPVEAVSAIDPRRKRIALGGVDRQQRARASRYRADGKLVI